MNKITNFGHGYRTYLSAILMLVWAGYGFFNGTVDATTAQLIVIEALAIFGLRKAMK